MPLDVAAVSAAAGPRRVVTARQLCGEEIEKYRRLAAEGEVIVACTAMRALFQELAEDAGFTAAQWFVNVRETAGWSSEAAAAGPKMAALIEAAAIGDETPVGVSFESEGIALIYGRDQRAIDVAERLKERLDITVILQPGSDVVPPRMPAYPVRQGRVTSVKGHLGAFEIGIDAFAGPRPSSRARLAFVAAQDGAVSQADILIDLSGGTPLVAAFDLREGYLRADPANAAEVERLVARAADLVGTFDKPRYITFREDLCAHAHSRITGCTRCLDLCPAGAIVPAGSHVAIDPHICAGCGQCAAACPTGAASYAVPAVDAQIKRLKRLLSAYRAAGGRSAQVLFHDKDHGEAMIDAAARFGDGLPASTLPFAVNEATQVGLETIAAAFAYGAASVRFVARARPRHAISGLEATIATANTLLAGLGFGEDLVGVIETDDPDALVMALRDAPIATAIAKPSGFLATGGKRDVLRLALRELHRAAPAPVDVLPLPAGAVFGRIVVSVSGCTLCLSCVSACPTKALSDATDRPRLAFDESLCVQCGLCVGTCPEKVIRLEPRLDFTAFEAPPVVLKEEEPFCCVNCSKPFGVKSTIERVIKRLEDQHWMFSGANKARIDLIRMCEDCRVETTINIGVDPFAGPARPPARTSEDYFREREAKATGVQDRESDMLKKIEDGKA